MKLNSPLFDRIRVKRTAEEPVVRARAAVCQWPGCQAAGTHRAPKGRGRDGEYLHFCLDHVREYNQSYNYFAGMSDDEVAAWQKAAVTGHRPTWKMGVNGVHASAHKAEAAFEAGEFAFGDPFRVFGARPAEAPQPKARGRTIRNGERKALAALDLDVDATREEIKARFKTLAKRHHPDVNGGDTSSEDRLRDIISAYNYLKGAGLC
ncbi:J domain-containing protein [Blastochloris sulfoviridis]|uniref:J domain-containing protein n=1 Tax=Blastochloris sulfoviridis TaxID=50712 RepID=A0A5M6I4W4_9HYPH|nr:J domain-containing protein [Blastochloris sulfoviridis]KAA5603276.1 J domain-containing protein [Blastochloris sulfoviridis]